MNIGTVFSQVWNTNPVWSTASPSTQAVNGTTGTSGGQANSFASTLQSVTAELQQFVAGNSGGQSSGGSQSGSVSQQTGTTQVSATPAGSSGTTSDGQTTGGTDFGDQLGYLAGNLSSDALLALQLYTGGVGAILV